ncbi:hypothetical protein EJB05_36477, partial [Eragrostis curvula]
MSYEKLIPSSYLIPRPCSRLPKQSKTEQGGIQERRTRRAMASTALSSAFSLIAVTTTSSSFLSKPALPFPTRVHGRFAVACTSTTASPKILELGDAVAGLTLEEARGLVDHLQERLGVSAAAFAPAAVVAAPGAGGAAGGEEAAAPAEKTEFDVVIEEVPSSARIATIKVEAKDLIEGLPKKLKEAVSKEEAEDAKKQLEEVGAKVTIA